MAILNREAVPSYSPGLPLRLPWVNAVRRMPNRNAVAAVLIRRERDATALRLLTVFINDPRVADAATLGCGWNRVAVTPKKP